MKGIKLAHNGKAAIVILHSYSHKILNGFVSQSSLAYKESFVNVVLRTVERAMSFVATQHCSYERAPLQAVCPVQRKLLTGYNLVCMQEI
jgi:hypothetical protein